MLCSSVAVPGGLQSICRASGSARFSKLELCAIEPFPISAMWSVLLHQLVVRSVWLSFSWLLIRVSGWWKVGGAAATLVTQQ